MERSLGFLLLMTAALPACIDFSDLQRRPDQLATPEWRVGESWNYTLRNPDGTSRGWTRYVVEAKEPVPEIAEDAYRVRKEIFRETNPHRVGTLIEHYDVANLNLVWNECGGNVNPCKGRVREFDFPLQANKSWSQSCCGDVVTGEFRFVVHRRTETLGPDMVGSFWVIEKSYAASGEDPQVHESYWFRPGTGLFTQRTEYDWGARTYVVWALTSHDRP